MAIRVYAHRHIGIRLFRACFGSLIFERYCIVNNLYKPIILDFNITLIKAKVKKPVVKRSANPPLLHVFFNNNNNNNDLLTAFLQSSSTSVN